MKGGFPGKCSNVIFFFWKRDVVLHFINNKKKALAFNRLKHKP